MTISKKRRRQLELQNQQNGQNPAQQNHFTLRHIKPLTVTQDTVFDSYYSGKNLMLHGYPGTGKTFLSLYLALKDVLFSGTYKKVVIVRSVVILDRLT